MKAYRYPWPASAIGADEMALLHSARESPEADTRVPITQLIVNAIRAVYGCSAETPSEQPERQ